MAQLGLEAKAAGLLVPRSAVGRWLGDLFEPEKVEEIAERERLVSMATDDIKPSEGTVVLAARPGSGSRFRAPEDPAESLPYDDSLSAAGTDLSVDVAPGDATDAQPAPAPSLGAVVPSDVTDAAEVAGIVEIAALDGMPTRAVTIQPELLDFEEESGTHEMMSRPDLVLPSTADVSDDETHFKRDADQHRRVIFGARGLRGRSVDPWGVRAGRYQHRRRNAGRPQSAPGTGAQSGSARLGRRFALGLLALRASGARRERRFRSPLRPSRQCSRRAVLGHQRCEREPRRSCEPERYDVIGGGPYPGRPPNDAGP